MSDRKKISYRYTTVEAWQELDEKVRDIITEDTGKDIWMSTKSLPPISFPP
ncbi:hypothetical protein POX_c03875 [Penicillium oxalicum]|nr:hypothetical protein POX_c03875 [Penicillium oxalicum]KAI2791021.1 hypothetical protein POX_c03875 [Penicillium oxalicum]